MATDINSFVSIKLINNELSSAASNLLSGKDFIGASLSVRCSSNYYWNKVLGTLDKDAKENLLGFNHKFLIYSLTKTYTAVCVLKLVEAGAFDLNTQVSNLVKDFPGSSDITIRHLLNHTSGLPDYGHLENYQNDVNKTPKTPWTKSQFDRVLTAETMEKPGEKWMYSNIGYMYLKLISESQTNYTYKKLVDEIITTPLNLNNTTVVETLDDLKPLVSGNSQQLSDSNDTIDIRGIYHPNWCAPGLISSTAQDIAKFYGTIFDTEFLSASSRQEMLNPIKVNMPHVKFKTPSYGMGLMIDPDNRLGVIAGHGGSGPGYSATCLVRIQPQKDTICATILSNSENFESLEAVAINLLSQFA